MQDNLQTADTVKITVPAPVELTAEELQQVGGGITDTSAVAGPHDNW
jgi:hypothetical protein